MLDSGTYAVNAGVLVLSHSTVVSGVGARSTTVEGNGSDRVFATGGSANATLASMTIRGGFSTGSGGNIAVASGTELGLVFARVTGGVALRGAGVLNEGTLNVANSLIDGNTAQFIGGGIDNVAIDGAPAELLVGESTVANNYAAEGAGISSRGTAQNTVDLLNATIARNTGGSGIWFQEQQQTQVVRIDPGRERHGELRRHRHAQRQLQRGQRDELRSDRRREPRERRPADRRRRSSNQGGADGRVDHSREQPRRRLRHPLYDAV